jgi:SAM-dependent methyltransferase
MIVVPQRRVQGSHDNRLDGLFDLVLRARGCSVLDLGCNRGHVLFEMAANGARLVHGLELAPDAIELARAWFTEVDVASQFEVGDLTRGPSALEPFGDGNYDIILKLATYHKIKRPPSKPYADLGARAMSQEELSDLMRHLGHRTTKFFGFRADRGNLRDIAQLDSDLGSAGLRRVHLSDLSDLGPTAIWRR